MTTSAPPDLRITLTDFVRWRREHLAGRERGEAQVFLDRLFQALGHGGVRETGATFEEPVNPAMGGGYGFIDLLWKPRVLIEMKKGGADLSRHYRQAFQYWVQTVPDRPRYVILCNFDEFWIYDFDNQLDAPVDVVRIDDLPARADALAFMLPTPATPVFGNDLVAVTREAAAGVSHVFRSVHARGIDRRVAQRFVLQCVVAMFSEDIGLLPGKVFTRALDDARSGTDAYDLLGSLFVAMNTPGVTPGGRFAGTQYFNGGLFAAVEPVDLTTDELELLREAAKTNWAAVRPEIFGTLFETSMDAGERHALGAHFTSQVDIASVVLPTIVVPWQERIAAATKIGDLEQILLDMSTYRVLDPACGAGNFLYVAYREMRRLEAEANAMIRDRRRSANLAAQGTLSYVTPDHFLGIDKNPFAVEVAKVTMMLAKKLAADELDEQQAVLPLDNLDTTVVAGDALFDPWPRADAIVGNPPYLGRRKMVAELGADYCSRLAERYPGVAGVSDFVCYWFPLAHQALPDGGRAGLVATKTIRETDSRRASLDYIVEHDGVIVDAVSAQPWSGDAVVHVSIVNWVKGARHAPARKVLWLDKGQLRLPVDHIPTSLSPNTDVATAVALPCNQRPKVCFQGQTTGNVDAFRLTLEQARSIVRRDPKSERFIHAMTSGDPLLHQLQPSMFVIDLPFADASEAAAEAPGALAHLREHALPGRQEAAQREANRNAEARAVNPRAKLNRHHERFLSVWWRHAYRRDDMVRATGALSRYIALTRVAAEGRKSVYQFVDSSIRPDDSLTVLALDDDYSFGVLSSQLHREWFDARCSRLKADPRYTSTTVFDSFPWAPNPSTEQVAAVAGIVKELLDVRESYLNRGVPLADQYDTLRLPGRSALRDLHDRLDAAVYALYGFSPDDDDLSQLLALNLAAANEPHYARRPGGGDLHGAYTSTYRLGAPDLGSHVAAREPSLW
jgi:hypothetical protein